MTALEGRAASYEKLKDFTKAQADARAMISLCPDNHKVYVRIVT